MIVFYLTPFEQQWIFLPHTKSDESMCIKSRNDFINDADPDFNF